MSRLDLAEDGEEKNRALVLSFSSLKGQESSRLPTKASSYLKQE